MSGPDCKKCGEHFTDCKCSPIGSFLSRYGSLKDISYDQLVNFLQDNETYDAAFLAIVCSEILRRDIQEREKEFRNNDY